MKGTAVFLQDNCITILEDVEKYTFETYTIPSDATMVWCENEIDWDYGY
ncbi:hypothetical protein MUG87_06770 [Ectobacillus sp. JY-23]|nr:hypothetical protein [Ectobacillus sp. JY-23]UOY93815.1 hypothetical protein MUG87_06770 [Ectobacillus sp. JY-23]